jgi:uncharacterized protein
MMRAVIDTNILVSALLTPNGNPAKVLDYVLNGAIVLCYDSRLIAEYLEVLHRPKFGLDRKSVSQVIDFFVYSGISIIPTPLTVNFEDPDDKKFYEVAISANAFLVTGNIKHFPHESMVVTPADFLKILVNGL